MIKLENILKELSIQAKPKLGAGEEHDVYPFNKQPNYVIKQPKTPYSDNEKYSIYQKFELFNKFPELFARVKKLNDRYVVIEKLNTQKLIEYFDFFESLQKYGMYRLDPEEVFDWEEFPPDNSRNSSQESIRSMKRNLFKRSIFIPTDDFIKANYILDNFMDFENRCHVLYDYLILYNKQHPEHPLYSDVHWEQVGYDAHNNLKFFDF